MKTAGIICEYNPFHKGHLRHIGKTKEALGGDAHIVCVMSGNYVQRGDAAVFNKHARAKTAVLCGADIVIELPSPYALGSAREFAKAGVYLLDSLGICDFLSFGSEAGSLDKLQAAASAIASEEAETRIREALGAGLPYAKAQQKAADALLGKDADVFKSPNNTLGIEYIKALGAMCSSIIPVTVKRAGGEHDGDSGFSASALRKSIAASGSLPAELMPEAAADVYRKELKLGRGLVLISNLEQAILSRLRAVKDFSEIPGASDGLDRRFLRAAASPSVRAMLKDIKTKRFAMSRIRRVMMCAVLGITNGIVQKTPPYIRVLAINRRGMKVLKAAGKTAKLPVITKPASVRRLSKEAVELFELESSATDFYALAYANEEDRTGGGEWRSSPAVV